MSHLPKPASNQSWRWKVVSSALRADGHQRGGKLLTKYILQSLDCRQELEEGTYQNYLVDRFAWYLFNYYYCWIGRGWNRKATWFSFANVPNVLFEITSSVVKLTRDQSKSGVAWRSISFIGIILTQRKEDDPVFNPFSFLRKSFRNEVSFEKTYQ